MTLEDRLKSIETAKTRTEAQSQLWSLADEYKKERKNWPKTIQKFEPEWVRFSKADMTESDADAVTSLQKWQTDRQADVDTYLELTKYSQKKSALSDVSKTARTNLASYLADFDQAWNRAFTGIARLREQKERADFIIEHGATIKSATSYSKRNNSKKGLKVQVARLTHAINSTVATVGPVQDVEFGKLKALMTELGISHGATEDTVGYVQQTPFDPSQVVMTSAIADDTTTALTADPEAQGTGRSLLAALCLC